MGPGGLSSAGLQAHSTLQQGLGVTIPFLWGAVEAAGGAAARLSSPAHGGQASPVLHCRPPAFLLTSQRVAVLWRSQSLCLPFS